MNLHLHQNRNPICIINLTPYSADVKFIRLLIIKNIYYWKKNISIVQITLFLAYTTPKASDFSIRLSNTIPRSFRRVTKGNSFSATSLISQLSWLPFVGQQLATNFPRPRIHRTSRSCATVQVGCFSTKCFLLRFFYSIIHGWGRATE